SPELANDATNMHRASYPRSFAPPAHTPSLRMTAEAASSRAGGGVGKRGISDAANDVTISHRASYPRSFAPPAHTPLLRMTAEAEPRASSSGRRGGEARD